MTVDQYLGNRRALNAVKDWGRRYVPWAAAFVFAFNPHPGWRAEWLRADCTPAKAKAPAIGAPLLVGKRADWRCSLSRPRDGGRTMLYVDTPFDISKDHPTAPRCFRGRQSAHLMADTESELTAYAVSIGMRAGWIQHPGTARVHFDVTGSRLARVLSDPRVKKITPREMAVMYLGRVGPKE